MLYDRLQPKSIEQTLDSNIPEIGAIEKKDHAAAVAIICRGIASLLAFLGLKQSMNPEQIAFTAELIIEDYPDIPVDALKLFFRKMAKGEYGISYNTMDGQKIMVAFRKFYDEYSARLEEQKYLEHDKTKSEKNVNIIEEVLAHTMSDADYEEIERRKNKLFKRGYYTDAELEKIDKIRKETIREFHKTHKMLHDSDFDKLEEIINVNLAKAGLKNQADEQ